MGRGRPDGAAGGPKPEGIGAFVLYADQGSFTLMTPQGHMFAGWTTFSAERVGEATIVRAHVLDSHRQWRNAKNVWHNAMLRSALQTLAAPLHRPSRPAV